MHLSVAFTPICDRTQRSHKQCGCAAAARCTSVVLTLPGAWKYLEHAWIHRLQPAIKPRCLWEKYNSSPAGGAGDELFTAGVCRSGDVTHRLPSARGDTISHIKPPKASLKFSFWYENKQAYQRWKVMTLQIMDVLSTIMLFWTKTFFPSCLPLPKLSSSFNWVLFKATEYFRTYQRVSQIKGIYLYQRSPFILHSLRLQQCNDINPLGIYKSSHNSQINK